MPSVITTRIGSRQETSSSRRASASRPVSGVRRKTIPNNNNNADLIMVTHMQEIEGTQANGDLEDLKKKFLILQEERKALIEQSMDQKNKNKMTIEQLKKTNQELKSEIKQNAQATGHDGSDLAFRVNKQSNNAEKELAMWRRKLDDMRNKTSKKQEQLKALQDKAKESKQQRKEHNTVDNPQKSKEVKMLENKLDKVMIKLNETLGVKKNYEGQFNKLKEEQLGFNSSLEDIENSLKEKTNDYENLLATNQDAQEAREQAETALRKYQVQKNTKRQQSAKNASSRSKLSQFNDVLSQKSVQTEATVIVSQEDNFAVANSDMVKFREKCVKLAMAKIQKETGISEQNELKFKIKSQQDTHQNLVERERLIQDKLADLTQKRDNLQEQLQDFKNFDNLTEEDRNAKIDELERSLNQLKLKEDEAQSKLESQQKNLVDAKAGMEHIQAKLAPITLQDNEILQTTKEKIQYLKNMIGENQELLEESKKQPKSNDNVSVNQEVEDE